MSANKLLSPHQLGIGVPSGCEIGGRSCQLAFDSGENLVVQSNDIDNGFNTIARVLMLRGLIEYCPELLLWYQYAYGKPTPLYYHGRHVCDMATGCKQGDNFSSLLFSVGLQQPLKEIDAMIQARISDFVTGCSSVGVVKAFMDDTSIFVDARIADDVAAATIEIFGRHRLTLNLRKCRFLVPPNTILPPGGLQSFPTETSGCIILGCPVGTTAYRQNYAETIVTRACRPIPALGQLNDWSTFSLLRHCVSPKVGYIARVSELAANLAAFQRFDSNIDDCLDALGCISPNELVDGSVRILRALPQALGGLGIPRFAGLAGETACLRSRERTYEHMEEFHPMLLSSVFREWPPIHMGRLEDSWIFPPDTSLPVPSCAHVGMRSMLMTLHSIVWTAPLHSIISSTDTMPCGTPSFSSSTSKSKPPLGFTSPFRRNPVSSPETLPVHTLGPPTMLLGAKLLPTQKNFALVLGRPLPNSAPPAPKSDKMAPLAPMLDFSVPTDANI